MQRKSIRLLEIILCFDLRSFSNSKETGGEQSKKIVSESSESGACAHPESKYMVTAKCEPDAINQS